jgi:hypothetical protein
MRYAELRFSTLQSNTRRLLAMMALGVSAFVAGCAEANPLGRQPVSGRITVEGSPLAAGAVMLDPGSEREGTAVGATIRDGAFTIERDQGPTPGIYKVRIYASSDVQAPVPAGSSNRKPRPMIERIPALQRTNRGNRRDPG